jgi:hypothetical protein
LQKLIPATQIALVAVASVAFNALVELVFINEFNDLREYKISSEHNFV